MTLQVTINLSEQIYEQVQQMALRQQKGVSETIASYLEHQLLSEISPLLMQTDADPDVERERAAYLQLHDTLWKTYPDEYVAIYNGQLVDHDPDKSALYARIQEKYPTQFVLMRQVKAEPEIVYNLSM
ncbi:MAG: hypothetical protein IAE79_25370 [Anaerolinea sp.]|nr:hypothetical protein [Anaerolinea sp.]